MYAKSHISLVLVAITCADGALACDWGQFIPGADFRAVQEGPIAGAEVLSAARGGIWWIWRHGAVEIELVDDGGDELDVAPAIVTESFFGVEVPESGPGPVVLHFLDGDLAGEQVELEISEGRASEVRLPELSLLSVESVVTEEPQGCSGTVDVLRVETGRARFRVGDFSEGRFAVDLWNLPSEDALRSGESPQVWDVVPAEQFLLVNDGELVMDTRFPGRRTLHFRFIDLVTGETTPIVSAELPERGEPEVVGRVFLGVNCQQTGQDGALQAMAVLAVLLSFAHRRRSAGSR